MHAGHGNQDLCLGPESNKIEKREEKTNPVTRDRKKKKKID